MAITNIWDEAAPAGGDAPSTIDNEIRKDRVNVRERMSTAERGGHLAAAGGVTAWPHGLNAAGKWFVRNAADTADAWSVELNPTAEIVTREITSNGTAADDLVVNKCVKIAVAPAATVVALTIALADNSAYIFKISMVAQRNAARTPAANEYAAETSAALARRNAGGVATLGVPAAVSMGQMGGATVFTLTSVAGNDVRINVVNSMLFAVDAVVVVRYFRVA
jgi:hypothetical protein